MRRVDFTSFMIDHIRIAMVSCNQQMTIFIMNSLYNAT